MRAPVTRGISPAASRESAKHEGSMDSPLAGVTGTRRSSGSPSDERTRASPSASANASPATKQAIDAAASAARRREPFRRGCAKPAPSLSLAGLWDSALAVLIHLLAG